MDRLEFNCNWNTGCVVHFKSPHAAGFLNAVNEAMSASYVIANDTLSSVYLLGGAFGLVWLTSCLRHHEIGYT